MCLLWTDGVRDPARPLCGSESFGDEESNPGFVGKLVLVISAVVENDSGGMALGIALQVVGTQAGKACVGVRLHEEVIDQAIPTGPNGRFTGRSGVAFIDPLDQFPKGNGLSWL